MVDDDKEKGEADVGSKAQEKGTEGDWGSGFPPIRAKAHSVRAIYLSGHGGKRWGSSCLKRLFWPCHE